MHDDAGQERQLRLHLGPDPAREILARRILEAGNLVLIVMIEPIERRLKRCAHIGEIHDPSGMRIDLACQMQLHSERVPVQACTLVPRRYVGQPMRGFDGEGAEEVHTVDV